MDRREFLKTTGALVVSFAAPMSEVMAQAAGKPPLVPGELDSWIAVLPNGRVQAFFGKMDMGQGLDVAVAQIVAEELDVGFDKVDVVMGDTGSSCNQGGASGSTGVSNGARLLRRAAAEARRMQGTRHRREFDQGHRWRACHSRQGLRRGSGAEGMGRGARGAEAEDRLGSDAGAVPGDGPALRPYSRRKSGQAPGRGEEG